MDAPDDSTRRRALFDRHHSEQRELIDEITAAARRIAEARDDNGEPVFRTDGVWRVLTTVATSPYCLAIADLARSLGVRKQTAHELATTTHVVKVVRQRLEPDARELARRKANR
jgi:hypothetical protein